jgi:nucleoside-diphosphate kinase
LNSLPTFGDLVRFMTSGPCVVMAIEGENAIAKYREVMGATDSKKAAAGHDPREVRHRHREECRPRQRQSRQPKIELGYFFTGSELA